MSTRKPNALLDQFLKEEIGVLNEDQLQVLFDVGIIEDAKSASIDGSAFDLHLSSEAYQVDFTSKLKKHERVRDLLNEGSLRARKFDVNNEVLKKGNVYLIRLKEKIHLSKYEGTEG